MSTASVRADGVLAGSGDTVTLNVGGMGLCAMQLAGVWAGTVTFEVSLTKDTWTAVNMTPPNSTTSVTSSTANGLWSGSVAGMQAARARCSAFTSGLIYASLQAMS